VMTTPGADTATATSMTGILAHLGELRRRLAWSAIVFVGLFMGALCVTKPIVDWLKRPLEAAMPEGVAALHFTGPMDVLFLNIKVAGLAALILAAPFWLAQVWGFVRPGLYPAERKLVRPFMVASIALFLAGVAFCYYVVLPFALEYLIAIGLEVGTPIITVTDYMGLVILLMAGFGLVFETPVLLVLLALVGVIDAQTLATRRRAALVVILLVAAVLTPTPDPFNQLLMGVPLYVMFEISILLIRWLVPKRDALSEGERA
jgi:sec-independent protein translocase protein TatC